MRSAQPAEPLHWGGALTLGAGPAWGDAVPAVGLNGPSYQLDVGLRVSHRFFYAAAGVTRLAFDDSQSLRADVMPVLGGNVETRKASGAVAGGYVEAGLLQHLFIPWEKPEAGHDQGGVGLVPGVGFGFQGIGTAHRPIANCSDCTMQSVVDYHGGGYLRFQLGVAYAACHPGARTCALIGVTPSYQLFVLRDAPSLSGALHIALSLGMGNPSLRW